MDKLASEKNFSIQNFEESDESITVTQLNRLAKTLLENNMPIIWIKGEISGIRTYSHIYFDLKDENAKVSCVLFAGLLKLLDFDLENGQQVEVRGRITIYPQSGSYQINVERIRKVGMGELWEAYNRLLTKLRLEGLFDQEHKQKIPVFPKTIGVITSSVGAVIRDVVTTLNRRMPNITIIVYHTAVQGSDAGMQIAKAIKTANIRNEVDVLIVCRGGGSMEDLWCFNEEVVARETFMSKIPIISAIGHETDTTIIDFVADLRAPTPTAAAELVAKSKVEWDNMIASLQHKLSNSFIYTLDNSRKKLDLYSLQLRHLNPVNQLRERVLCLSNYTHRINSALKQMINQKQNYLDLFSTKLGRGKVDTTSHKVKLDHLFSKLQSGLKDLIANKKQQIITHSKHLELVNPTNILSRGYAIVRNRKNNVVYSSNDVKNHERVEIILKDDSVSAIVDKDYNPSQEELL